MIDDTPNSYAKHLATYIPCPQRIQTMTRNYFGRAPALSQCSAYRHEIERKANRFKALAEHKDDGPLVKFKCGHPREDNTGRNASGRPICAACERARKRRQYAAQKAREEAEAARLAERRAALLARETARAAAKTAALTLRILCDKPSVNEIANVTATLFDVSVEDMKGRQQRKPLMRPRFAIYLVARQAGHSYPLIGKRLGRDHSSIIYGCKIARQLIDHDPDFAAMVRKINAAVWQ